MTIDDLSSPSIDAVAMVSLHGRVAPSYLHATTRRSLLTKQVIRQVQVADPEARWPHERLELTELGQELAATDVVRQTVRALDERRHATYLYALGRALQKARTFRPYLASLTLSDEQTDAIVSGLAYFLGGEAPEWIDHERLNAWWRQQESAAGV